VRYAADFVLLDGDRPDPCDAEGEQREKRRQERDDEQQVVAVLVPGRVARTYYVASIPLNVQCCVLLGWRSTKTQ